MLRSLASRIPLVALYALVGAVAGLVIIHPLVLAFIWVEAQAIDIELPPLFEFLRNRTIFLVIPTKLDVAAAFGVIGALVGAAFGLFTRSYFEKARNLRFLLEKLSSDVPALIAGGETNRVEFKSSLRWDVKENRVNKALEKVIAKTIAGLFNANGGSLLIGVADDGEVLGLEKDYASLHHKNRDGFERTLNDVVTKSLGGDLCPYLNTTFSKIDGKDVCLVIVQPSPRAVYLIEGKTSLFYVRSGNSTRQLDVREALDYARERWHQR